ncbi:tellurium resistance protein [Streptomyces sp. GbtcB7]|uniref:vWA domain-containing protein n=1 Tax=Streptomyces sp. GbtcB7 TaxID=2824752 RepID=UPI001C3036BF|nr:tellurium resistance protein [Streptomyces sp. GbtcB7]
MQRDPLDIPVSFRPLHFFWIVDTSGSMTQKSKIQQLNTAVKEALPHMRDAAREHVEAQVWVRVLKFDNTSQWVGKSTDLNDFEWKDLAATEQALTSMGSALTKLGEQCHIPPMPHRGFPPVLVLLSGSHCTDDFTAGLAKLNSAPWGMKAVRIAIAIGDNADKEALRRFAGPEYSVLDANNPDQLTAHIRWVSEGPYPDLQRPS